MPPTLYTFPSPYIAITDAVVYIILIYLGGLLNCCNNENKSYYCCAVGTGYIRIFSSRYSYT